MGKFRGGGINKRRHLTPRRNREQKRLENSAEKKKVNQEPILDEEIRRVQSIRSKSSDIGDLDLSSLRRSRTSSCSSSRSRCSSVDSTRSSVEDQYPVYLLTELESLLEEVQPGSLVALDIDETILVTRDSPSLLLTTEGVVAFQKFVHVHVKNWELKNKHCKALETAMKSKVSVEPTTALTIKELQGRGVQVFGLTARYREYSAATERELKSVGVELLSSSPFPAHISPNPAHMDHSEGLYGDSAVVNGVVYCNNQDKGLVLKGLLQSFLFKEVLTDLRALPVTVQATERDKIREGYSTPPELYFVDDLYSNVSAVSSQVTPILKELDVALSAYHYVPKQLADAATFPNPDKFTLNAESVDEEQQMWQGILNKQMQHFLQYHEVLSNRRAREALGLS